MLTLVMIPSSKFELQIRRRRFVATKNWTKTLLRYKEIEFQMLREKSRGVQTSEIEIAGHEIVRLRAEIEACDDGVSAIDEIMETLRHEEGTSECRLAS